MQKRSRGIPWLLALLGMLTAIPLALFGLMQLFGSFGTRVDGIVPLVVAVAIVLLAVRGLAAGPTRDPVRASARNTRSLTIAGLLGLALVVVVAWRAWSYGTRCEEMRAFLRSNQVSKVAPRDGGRYEPVKVDAPHGQRVCYFENGTDKALVETRTGCSVGLEAAVWRWLYWHSGRDEVNALARYVTIDDGKVVHLMFRE